MHDVRTRAIQIHFTHAAIKFTLCEVCIKILLKEKRA